MPVLKSSQRALRRQQRRAKFNRHIRQAYKAAVKAVREQPNLANLTKAFASLDKAAKKRVIHTNKAARLKSRLNILLNKASSSSPTKLAR